MSTVFALGIALTVTGLVGYVVGIAAPYPGRAFSLTLLMLGMALAAVARAGASTQT